MTNVVQISEYRTSVEAAPKAADPAEMDYDVLCQWAGTDFDRLLRAREARNYRPEWISHTLADAGVEPTPAQAAVLAGLVAAAGPYLNRRLQWVLRQLKAKPMSASALTKLATKAAPYRGYANPGRCLAHDLSKLVTGNLIESRGLVYYPVVAAAGEIGGVVHVEARP